MEEIQAKSLGEELERNGFILIQDIYTTSDIAEVAQGLEIALDEDSGHGDGVCRREEMAFAARNLLSVFPLAAPWWRKTALVAFLHQILGQHCGLVRALFFDKPPQRSWALPWHRDETIAVERNDLPSEVFSRPTKKAGIAHVIASRELLDRMLTLRIHLDTVHDDNGPLKVLAGSHHQASLPDATAQTVHTITAAAGDVLAMRPRLCHASGHRNPGHSGRRRVLHLEFAADPHLPDGYRWHKFIPVGPSALPGCGQL